VWLFSDGTLFWRILFTAIYLLNAVQYMNDRRMGSPEIKWKQFIHLACQILSLTLLCTYVILVFWLICKIMLSLSISSTLNAWKFTSIMVYNYFICMWYLISCTELPNKYWRLVQWNYVHYVFVLVLIDHCEIIPPMLQMALNWKRSNNMILA